MKKPLITLGLSLAILLPSAVLACGAPPELEKQLQLNPDQSAKLDTILQKYRSRHEALRGKHEQARDAARREMEAIDTAQHQELATVLNPAQLKTLEEWQRSHRPPRPDHGEPPASRGDRPLPDANPEPQP
ncbi:hypothetical protein EV700_0340 [Fluviicoccus keumensis]|uniref:Spy/CpxP family protein refolding chaperone n=1 Tax=Fluviicoccus keumensis TaxID=1435465 RepID=A0A4Q7ZC01_9GAMM|nr:hypothetical protein [Fluviicoccus keumensis]RZU47379.1 hypothetical protein EV700_0340 [Fluviicoccus keumensis]